MLEKPTPTDYGTLYGILNNLEDSLPPIPSPSREAFNEFIGKAGFVPADDLGLGAWVGYKGDLRAVKNLKQKLEEYGYVSLIEPRIGLEGQIILAFGGEERLTQILYLGLFRNLRDFPQKYLQGVFTNDYHPLDAGAHQMMERL